MVPPPRDMLPTAGYGTAVREQVESFQLKTSKKEGCDHGDSFRRRTNTLERMAPDGTHQEPMEPHPDLSQHAVQGSRWRHGVQPYKGHRRQSIDCSTTVSNVHN
jgi:hypothetical protein